MNLNLASGLHPTSLPGWVNVDLPWDGVKKPHLFADAFHLPFPPATFRRCYLGHFLEHVEWDDLAAIGAELRRTLAPGARVMVVGPDIDRAVSTRQPQWLLDAITDLNGGPGGHKWVANESRTRDAVAALGLSQSKPVDVATVASPRWPNPSQAAWQCAITAIRT